MIAELRCKVGAWLLHVLSVSSVHSPCKGIYFEVHVCSVSSARGWCTRKIVFLLFVGIDCDTRLSVADIVSIDYES